MRRYMVAAIMTGLMGLNTAVIQAAVITNIWTGSTSSAVDNNDNWSGYLNPLGYAVAADGNGDTHVGVINNNGTTAPVISWGGQINNTVLTVNNSAVITQTSALNTVGVTLTLNNNAAYNAGANIVLIGSATTASTLTINDSATLGAFYIQIGKAAQGIVNQNGGSVTLTNLQLGVGTPAATASRYNFSAGSLTVETGFYFGASDAGADGGTYFNFTEGNTGTFTIMADNFDFAKHINAGRIRCNDTKYSATDSIWNIDTSVAGQTTLSMVPEPRGMSLFVLGTAGIMFVRNKTLK